MYIEKKEDKIIFSMVSCYKAWCTWKRKGGVCKIPVSLWNRSASFNNKGKRSVDCISVFTLCGSENS